MLEGSRVETGEECEKEKGAKQLGQSWLSGLSSPWEIHPTQSCCFTVYYVTSNTEIAGIILVRKEHRPHKKAIFHEKIFNFAQKCFDFLSSKLSRQQPSCWLGKLFQLCLRVAKSQIDQSLPRGKLKATFILFGFQSARLSHLRVSSREGWDPQPSASCSAHLQISGAGGEGGQPQLRLPEMWGPSPFSSYTQTRWKPPADFTWHPLPRSFRWAARNLPPEVALVLNIPFAIFTSTYYVLLGFFMNAKAFLLRNHQSPGQNDHKLLLPSPSGHIYAATIKMPMDASEAKPADGLPAILQRAMTCAEQSRLVGGRSCSSKKPEPQTKHKTREPTL